MRDEPTESLRCWKAGGKQLVKWTAEGTVKGRICRVFCDVGAYVSCLGYVGTCKVYGASINQGGTADCIFVPGRE